MINQLKQEDLASLLLVIRAVITGDFVIVFPCCSSLWAVSAHGAIANDKAQVITAHMATVWQRCN